MVLQVTLRNECYKPLSFIYVDCWYSKQWLWFMFKLKYVHFPESDITLKYLNLLGNHTSLKLAIIQS